MNECATYVTVSYPEDLSEWGRFQVEKPSFRTYLRKYLPSSTGSVSDLH